MFKILDKLFNSLEKNIKFPFSPLINHWEGIPESDKKMIHDKAAKDYSALNIHSGNLSDEDKVSHWRNTLGKHIFNYALHSKGKLTDPLSVKDPSIHVNKDVMAMPEETISDEDTFKKAIDFLNSFKESLVKDVYTNIPKIPTQPSLSPKSKKDPNRVAVQQESAQNKKINTPTLPKVAISKNGQWKLS